MSSAVSIPRYRPAKSRRELLSLAQESAQEPARERAMLGTPPPLAVIALNRMAFGPRPGDIAAFNALGADDDARLAAYVAQQINPGLNPVVDDVEYWSRRVASGHTTLGLTLQQLWQTYETGGASPSNRPVEEVRMDTFSRMVYSKWQLREVLADFWHNHFNVYGFENYTQETFVHWDRDVIRWHLFGNFRAFLEAVARSTTMLYYLDNYTNTRNGPNENWARELFELHTLGAENYFGVGNQGTVPAWPGGAVWPPGTPNAGDPIPAGYVDDDVYETGRCFTGWSRNSTTGLYQFNAGDHDTFQKAVLSFGIVNIDELGGETDGELVLDMLAAHPGTGRHIARKLCRRLIGENVPESLVEDVGDLFTAQWLAPDQLKQVYQMILLSPEFKTTWGDKIKRPIDHTVSILRACNANWTFGYTSQNPLTMDSDTSNLLSRQSRTGQNLFGRIPPDGFPDIEAPWTGTNTRLQCWRLAGWLIDQDIDGQSDTDDFRLDVLGTTFAVYTDKKASSNELVDFWIPRIYGREIDPSERAELVDFMRQGNGADFELNLGASSTLRSRLRSLIALMCMLPEFFLK